MTLPMTDKLRGREASGQGGLGHSLEKALNEHWAWVCETLYYLIGDWDAAQDLALETFWRLHTRPPRRTDDSSYLSRWLYRVATNLGLNAIRPQRTRSRHEKVAGEMTLERGASVNPEDELQRRQVRQQVRHVLSHMQRRKSRLLMLRYSDHSYAEIAEILRVAAELSTRIDWTTTLVLAFPHHVNLTHETVSVRGIEASLIHSESDYRPTREYVLTWIEDHVIYAVAGKGDESEALELVASMPK